MIIFIKFEMILKTMTMKKPFTAFPRAFKLFNTT